MNTMLALHTGLDKCMHTVYMKFNGCVIPKYKLLSQFDYVSDPAWDRLSCFRTSTAQFHFQCLLNELNANDTTLLQPAAERTIQNSHVKPSLVLVANGGTELFKRKVHISFKCTPYLSHVISN